MRARLLLCFFLLLPTLAGGDDRIAVLEETALHYDSLQPGLERHFCRVLPDDPDVLARVAGLTENVVPADIAGFVRYWQHGRQGLVTTLNGQPTSTEQAIAGALANLFDSALESPLIPAGKAEQRRAIAARGILKTSETQLGETLLKRIELNFDTPVDLDEAFFTRYLPLPQKQITRLYFDLDAGSRTIQELGLLTAAGLSLTLEMRYHATSGGSLPARLKSTSLDGQIDDLIEIDYDHIDGFDVPVKLTRVMIHPQFTKNLTIFFKDYRINQPFPEAIRDRFRQMP